MSLVIGCQPTTTTTMAKPAHNFTASSDSLIAHLRLKEGEEAYNKCRSRFFMDAMKLVSDRVASGDPTAKSLEADYATLVETRASQNRHSKVKKTRTNNETQATEDLESKFQVLADAAGTLPGQPGYKRLLRKFLTGEHAANAEKYYSNARNVNDKNKLFRFEALALVCGLEYDTPIYNKVYSDFFQKKGTLLASALQSANGYEPSSTAIMEHETKTFPSATASPQKSSDESTTMRSLRNKLAAARINGAPSEPVSQMPEPETRFQRLVLSLGLIEGSNGYKRHRCQFFYYESFRDEVLKSRDDIAVEKLGRFEECCATRGLQQGTNEFRIFKYSSAILISKMKMTIMLRVRVHFLCAVFPQQMMIRSMLCNFKADCTGPTKTISTKIDPTTTQ